MQKKPDTETLKKLLNQHQAAIMDLLKLAGERKTEDLNLWNDPEEIQKVIRTVDAQIEESDDDVAIFKNVIKLTGLRYSALLRYYVQQEEAAFQAGKVNDSPSSYSKLMLYFEILFTSFAGVFDYELELLAGSGEAFETVQDALYDTAKEFQDITQAMREHHDQLFTIKYLIKM